MFVYIHIYLHTQTHTHIPNIHKVRGSVPSFANKKSNQKISPHSPIHEKCSGNFPLPPKSTYNANIGLARYLQNIGHQMSSEQNKVCTDQLAGRVNTYV